MEFLKFVSILFGSYLLYIAIFIYEDSEKKIQNRLQDWWIELSDRKEKWTTKHKILIRKVTSFIEEAFISLFGEKIISRRFIAVSLTLSLVSIYTFFYSFYPPTLEETKGTPIIFYYICNGLIIYLLLEALIKGFVLKSKAFELLLYLLLSICFLVIVFGSVYWGRSLGVNISIPHFSGGVTLIFILFLLSDILFLAITRICYKYFDTLNTGSSLIIITINFCLVTILAFYISTPKTVELLFDIPLDSYPHKAQLVSTILNISNFPAIIASGLFFLIGTTFFIHRVTWEFIKRPIYVLQRYNVISKKAMIIALGLILLKFGIPELGPVLDKIGLGKF